MCFSAIAAYAPRPVQDSNGSPVPVQDTPWNDRIEDPNLYRPQNGHEHAAATSTADPAVVAAANVAMGAGVDTIESTIVTMPDGRRLMITPLD